MNAAITRLRARDWTLGLSVPERRFLLSVLVFNLALILGIGVVKLVSGMDLSLLMKDVVVVADLPPYAGGYQFVSILFYAFGAAVALFAAACLGVENLVRRLLILGGGYAAFACLDDLFLLHENGLYVGLPERSVIAVHGVLLIWLAVKALRLGPRTPWRVLAGSLGVSALAVVLDLPGYHFSGKGPAEEVFETLGAALLAAYLILTAFRQLAPRLDDRLARS